MFINVVGGGANAQVIVKGKVTLNSNGYAGMYSFLNSDSKLDIAVLNDATLNLDQNGSNGFRAVVQPGAELNVDVVKENGSFESCGNTQFDIYGTVDATATATFSGTGYTCDQAKVVFTGPGGSTVVKPVCQDCPPSL